MIELQIGKLVENPKVSRGAKEVEAKGTYRQVFPTFKSAPLISLLFPQVPIEGPTRPRLDTLPLLVRNDRLEGIPTRPYTPCPIQVGAAMERIKLGWSIPGIMWKADAPAEEVAE